jgi:hypothetical protein
MHMNATAAPTALQRQLIEYVNAGFSGIYVKTHEPDEALRELRLIERAQEWHVMEFDMDRGLSHDGANGDGNADPTGALKELRKAAERRGGGNGGSVLLVAPSFHRFLTDPMLVQTLQRTLSLGKEHGGFVVILAPAVQLPAELEKSFVVVEHALPDRDALLTVLSNVATEEDMPGDEHELNRLLDAAAGLTRYEAEGAFSLSLARHGRLDVRVLWELKSSMLKKTGTLELYRGGETFADLGGLDALKSFCKQSLTSTSRNARPRGVMLVGVAGGGKTAFAKALGNETGRPTVVLDFGSLMGGIVGQTEENTRKALEAVDAMAPCILFCDEIEKGLSGAMGGGQGDSGVGMRMLGTLLTWLNDHTSDVFFVGTCNDMSRLSQVSAGAFTRAERFDGIFFIDLPSPEQRDVIWDMYLKQYELFEDTTLDDVDDTNWTGAEIKSCCRLASLLGVTLKQAAANVVPVARTSEESINALRFWANQRVLDASKPGIFNATTAGDVSGRRRAIRRPQ